MNKTEACGFPIQLICINVKSTFALEPLKGDCFIHETARWNLKLLVRKNCSHDCEMQPVTTKPTSGHSHLHFGRTELLHKHAPQCCDPQAPLQVPQIPTFT